jgi:hypothetical protein
MGGLGLTKFGTEVERSNLFDTYLINYLVLGISGKRMKM